jgi:two-component system, NarL family, sensor histidine kinase DesK
MIAVTASAPWAYRQDGEADASRRASILAVAVLCLLLLSRVTDILVVYGRVTAAAVLQVCFTVALFVVPLLYPFRGPRRALARYRWPVLAVQAVLTWVPFAVFGDRWQVGIGGLLVGLVLLTVPGWASWLAAAALLTADVALRTWVTGLPWAPAWSGALWAALTFVDDAAVFFGMVRLAQVVAEVQEAQSRSAWLAVAGERLRAAGELRSAVGERLAGIAEAAAVARQVLASDPAGARARVSAAGAAAREAVAQARALAAGPGRLPQAEPAAAAGGGVVGARLAWAVLVVVLCAFAAAGLNDAAEDHVAARLIVLLAVGSVLAVGLQLHHSWAARQGGKPRRWPLTLGLQAVLAYAYFLPFLRGYLPLSTFLAGSILLLVRGRWRWAGYAAVVVSWYVLYATVPLQGIPAGDALVALYEAVSIAYIGLLVYALSRLAGMARELAALREQLARMAAVRERLRVARDVHDLLGLGLSAIALKTDLISALIGRDDARAAAEIEELSQVCEAARADIRLVTGGQRLSLTGALAAVRQVLASAGVRVHASVPDGQLPPAADDVLGTVLREAVTNIVRHSAATSCTIEVTAADDTVRLAVSNDGAAGEPAQPGIPHGQDAADGSGLANLTARLHAAGGQLECRQAGDRFELIAEVPSQAPPGADGATGPGTSARPAGAPGRPPRPSMTGPSPTGQGKGR